jgi:hypothetical protein
MRYRGAGRSPWPIIILILLVVVAVAFLYWLFFLAPPDIRP